MSTPLAKSRRRDGTPIKEIAAAHPRSRIDKAQVQEHCRSPLITVLPKIYHVINFVPRKEISMIKVRQAGEHRSGDGATEFPTDLCVRKGLQTSPLSYRNRLSADDFQKKIAIIDR
jgi:hypothetical protein